MTIYEKIKNDKTSKHIDDRPTLSYIMSEICVDGKPMNDDYATNRMLQLKKTSEKNISIYKKSGNDQHVKKEEKFIEILNKYLPCGAAVEDINNAIISLDIKKEQSSMGILMKYLKSKFDVVDGNLVRKVLIG